MLNILKSIGAWFVKSSLNKEAISLTVKGLVPFLVLFGVDQTIATSSMDSIVNLILVIGQLITGAITVIGFVRKILITITAFIKSKIG